MTTGTKDVALVLSSGSARGLAHIGAIDELLRRGYNITSVAGTSMGSLIGGLYASGRFDAAKEWFYSIDTWKMLRLIDFVPSMNYLVKGDKVINAIKEVVPDMNIQDMPVPFRAIATNFYTGGEVVFDSGSLFEAIRASISLPSLFRPAKRGLETMVDGGIVNPLPLDRAVRNGHDILVGVNVNYIDEDRTNRMLEENMLEQQEKSEESFFKRLHRFNEESIEAVRSLISRDDNDIDNQQENDITDLENSHYTILSHSFSLMICRNTILAAKITPADIMVNIPHDAFGGFDYDKAESIAEYGAEMMAAALDNYEESIKQQL